MSALLASFMLVGLDGAVSSTPRWEGVLDWGCLVQEPTGKKFTLGGYIAKKSDPTNPNVHEREQTAVIVAADSSGRFKEMGARGLYLRIPKPNVYWAVLNPQGSSLKLDLSARNGTGNIEIRTEPGNSVLGTGKCETRPVRQPSSGSK